MIEAGGDSPLCTMPLTPQDRRLMQLRHLHLRWWDLTENGHSLRSRRHWHHRESFEKRKLWRAVGGMRGR